jgi:hypothetical protein
MNVQRGNALAQQTSEERLATHRNIAEAMVQGRIIPAFETVREELHRPEQERYVTIIPLSPTSTELTISRTPYDAGDQASTAAPLRYILIIAFGSQAIVVKRIVNGKKGSFLGQHDVNSLSQRIIVDDVRRVWRRVETKLEARR